MTERKMVVGNEVRKEGKRKLVKLISSLALVGTISLCSCATTHKSKVQKYYDMVDEKGLFNVYTSPELTDDMIANRKGTVLVEVVIGKCIDAQTGAGTLFDEHQGYISYRDVPNIKTGDVVCTYVVYNPENNHEDDIIGRYDIIIESNK